MTTVVGTRFLGQLTSYPLINDTYSQAASYYDRVKNYSPYLSTPLGFAESGVKTAVSTTQPIMRKLEGPLTKVEDMACDGLTKIELRYPVVLKPTEELYEDGKSVVNKAIYPISKTLDNVVTYSQQTVESLSQTTIAKTSYSLMEQVVDTADNYADKYLPSDSEDTSEKEEGKNLLDKSFYLKNKVQRRMYTKAMKGLQEMKLRSDESLKKLHFTVDLMEYAKTQMSETKVKVGEFYSEINDQFAEELKREESEDEAESTSEDSILLQKTRAYANNVRLTVLATSTVFYKHLSEDNQMRLNKAKQFSENMYSQLMNTKAVTDLSENFFKNSRRTLEYVQDTLDSTFKYILQLKDQYLHKQSPKKAAIENSDSSDEAEDPKKE